MKQPRTRSRTRTVAYFVTALAITAVGIRVFVLDSFTVEGNSMAPTIIDGDYVFVNKLAYRKHAPERGDIVVGNFRGLDGVKAIKRVVGVPREWIYIEEGTISVASARDGERTAVRALDGESFAGEVSKNITYRLDPFEYFLVGDNGLTSIDSRDLGPVDQYRIDGKVILKIRLRSMEIEQF